MSLSPGDKLGPYEILSPLGAGGMGEVFKARDTRLDRVVAVKVSKGEFTKRFEHEARAIASLNHPHICQLYDVGPNYLVMEFLEGQPLRGPVPLNEALTQAGQILDALSAAHAKGFTHRDLKPGNILLTRQGIKLLDFGLAKRTAALADTETTVAGLTQEGQIVGTLQYMAPEQLQGKAVDARSDIFSFGCILYELLSGQRAFGGTNSASVMGAVLHKEPAPLNSGPALERIVRTCLEKDPDQRFQTARDVKRALEWSLEDRSMAAQPAPTSKRRMALFAAILAAGVCLGGFSAWRFTANPEPQALLLDIALPEHRWIDPSYSVSPDGKSVAYVLAQSRLRTELIVRSLVSAQTKTLAAGVLSYPFWSPDGRSLGFFQDGRLKRVELAGGAAVDVCAAFAPRGGIWTEEGHIIFGGSGNALYRVPVSGGTATPFTILDESKKERQHSWPQLLPGGRLLFLVRTTGGDNKGVYAASLAEPNKRVLLVPSDSNGIYAPLDKGGSTGYLLWLRSGTLVAQEFDPAASKLNGEPRIVAERVGLHFGTGLINAAAGGHVLVYDGSTFRSQLTWFDRKGTLLSTIGEIDETHWLRISPDGRVVSVLRRNPDGNSDIWLIGSDRGVYTRITSTPETRSGGVWSPDGRSLLFRQGDLGFLRKSTSGVGQEELVLKIGRANPTDLSADGRFLTYFNSVRGGDADIFFQELSPEGKPKSDSLPKPVIQSPHNEWGSRFSRESSPRWIVYNASDTGREEVYIQSFPSARGRWRVSTNGGGYPQWGPGGREVFYMRDSTLMTVPVRLGIDSVESGEPQELFTVPSSHRASSPFDSAPDGKRFVVLADRNDARPLTVAVHWSRGVTGGRGR